MRILVLLLIATINSWAGLCAQLDSTRFEATKISSYKWYAKDVNNLGEPDSVHIDVQFSDFQLISYGDYQVPGAFYMGCEWTRSNTEIHKLGWDTTTVDTIVEWYKLRDAEGIDVNNIYYDQAIRDIHIANENGYWIHQIKDSTELWDDGFQSRPNLGYYIYGETFHQTEPNTFEVWYATGSLRGSDGDYTINHNLYIDSNSIITSLASSFGDSYPYPEYEYFIHIIKLEFTPDIIIPDTEPETPQSLINYIVHSNYTILDNTIYWNTRQNITEIYDLKGQLIHTTNQSTINLNKLNPGFYIIKGDTQQFKLLIE